MIPNPPTSPRAHKHSVLFPDALHQRVERVAELRGTAFAPTLRWITERGLEWWERLPEHRQREK